MFCGGGPNLRRGGPNPLVDLVRGVQIRGGSKSAVTPALVYSMDLRWKTTNSLRVLFSDGRTVKIHTTEPHQVTVLCGLTMATRFTLKSGCQ